MGKHAHPEVSMHTLPLSEYVKFIEPGDWAGVAGLMLSSAEKLARAGADFLICPDNTIHQAFELVEHRSPRPWLHIAQEVTLEAKVALVTRRADDRRAGGTPWATGPPAPRPYRRAGVPDSGTEGAGADQSNYF